MPCVEMSVSQNCTILEQYRMFWCEACDKDGFLP